MTPKMRERRATKSSPGKRREMGLSPPEASCQSFAPTHRVTVVGGEEALPAGFNRATVAKQLTA